MKKIVSIIMVTLLLISCDQKKETEVVDKVKAETKNASLKKGMITGKILETMDASKYTYIKIKTTEGKEIWVAGPKQEIKVGNNVTVSTQMLMKKFKSKTLNRTFDEVYFVGTFDATKKTSYHGSHGMMAKKGSYHGKNNPHTGAIATTVKAGDVKKVEGGYTVSELFAKKSELKGKTVKVSGVVVKYTPQIMNTNWVHIQDGTGAKGTNDVTVTTQDLVEVGDKVVVTGTLAEDKDLGSGYFFPVLLEKSSLSKIEVKKEEVKK